MLSRNVLQLLKQSLTIKKYPTADRNAHAVRLAAQALPYFVSRNGFSFYPLSVFIHVNTRCNMKCKFCDAGTDTTDSMFYKNLKGGDAGDLPIESFKTIIDKVKFFKPFIGIPVIEPLFYKHIIEAIRYVRQQRLRISVATNGLALKLKAQELVDAGLTKIVISVDGPAEVHDQTRGVKGSYQKIIEGLECLAQAKRELNKKEPRVFINYVIYDSNYATITDFLKAFPMRLVDQINFRVMFYCTQELADKHNKFFGDKYRATSTCLSGGVDLKKVDTDVLYEQISKISDGYDGKCRFFFNHGKEGLRTHYHDDETFLDGTKCVFPWYTMQIDRDGNVIGPQRCYHNEFGNILKQDFEEIWNGERMRTFRKDLQRHGRFPACARCEGINF